MRVVLDTNVLVSGLIREEGPCGDILRLVFGGLLQPCLDDRVLEEYESVLPRPLFRIRPEDVRDTLDLIRRRAERIMPPPLRVQLPDPTDAAFLEVAAACDAILVTGNVRHFPSHARSGVAVMTPRQFLDSLRSAS